MEIAEREKNARYGRVREGDRIPYGTLVGASPELRKVFYTYGCPHDEDLPELPVGSVYDNEEPPPDPDEVVARNEMRMLVKVMLDTLTPREAKILRMRYGIETESDLTLEEVGKRFDVTRERIRQIEAKALRKLKHPQRKDVLAQFIWPDSIKTTADKPREQEKIIKRITAQDVEIQAQVFVKRSTRRELQQPRPHDMSWTEYIKQNAPDVYENLVAHIERYADKFLPR